jgi:hypothetical protein
LSPSFPKLEFVPKIPVLTGGTLRKKERKKKEKGSRKSGRGYVGDGEKKEKKKEEEGRCTWVEEKKGKEKRKKRGISYGCIEGG